MNDKGHASSPSSTCSRNGPPCLPFDNQLPTRRVGFSPVVQLIAFDDSGRHQVAELPMPHAHRALRTLWHLDGQCADSEFCMGVVGHWSRNFGWPQQHGLGQSSLGKGCPCIRRESTVRGLFPVPNIPVSEIEWWPEVIVALTDRPLRAERHFVETWFVDANRFPLCLRSRRIRIDRSDTDTTFQHKCHSMWADVLQPGVVATFFRVAPKPETFRATVEHVIIQQGNQRTHPAVMVHCDSFPLLAKYRVTTVRAFGTAQDLLLAAQHEGTRTGTDYTCCIRVLQPEAVYCDHQPIPLVSGMLVHGFVRPLPHRPVDMASESDDSTCATASEVESFTDDDSRPEHDEPAASAVPSRCRSAHGHDSSSATGHSSSDNSQVKDAALPSQELRWGELPLDFKLDDLLDESVPSSWNRRVPGDAISLMQRSRSRSRNDSEPVNESQPSDEDPESELAEGDEVDWSIHYTDMPEDPPPVRAPHDQGPTIAQVQQVLSFPDNAISSLHLVHSLRDSSHDFVVLVECVADHVDHASEAITLLDVVCRDTELPHRARSEDPHVFSSQFITRAMHSFDTIAGVLRLQPFMLHFPDLFKIVHNNREWHPGDPHLRRIRDGDHIEVMFQDSIQESFRRQLVSWLRSQGLNAWPELLQALAPVDPTVSFVAETPEMDQFCDEATDLIPGQAFTTWFISHVHHPECHDSRVVLLPHQPTEWRQILQRVWGDRMRPASHFTVSWITPQPRTEPIGRVELPHLLIEQHHQLNRVGVLLSLVRYAPTEPPFQQAAFSTPDRTPVRGYFDLLGIDRSCLLTHRCWVMHEEQELRDSEMVRRPTAQSISVHMRRIPPPPADEEDGVMMQLPTAPSAICSAGTGEAPIAEDPVIESPVAQASAPSYGTMHTSAADAVAWERLASLAQVPGSTNLCPPPAEFLVATYYLTSDRMRVCAFPRMVFLPYDGAHWRQRILQAWNDNIVEGEAVEILTVLPPPRQNEVVSGQVTAFLLVVQRRLESDCPVLFTIEESEEIIHIARMTTRTTTTRQLLQEAGLGRRCFCRALQTHCEVSIGLLRLPFALPTDLPLAASVHILLTTPEAPPALPVIGTPAAPTEANQELGHFSLLQLHTARRQIVGQVAHTQQPADVRQHFHPAGSTLDRASSPVQILLEPVLQLPRHAQLRAKMADSAPALLWFENSDWQGTTLARRPTAWDCLPDGLRLTPSSYAALVQQTPWDPNRPWHFAFYVDGATDYSGASWAIIAVIVQDQQEFFYGSLAGLVATVPDDAMWLGADHADNIAAEFTAFAIAQHVARPLGHTMVEIRPDLRLSMTVSNATTHCATHTRLAQIIQLQASWMPNMAVYPVKGHSAHPWNDLADSLAKHALSKECQVGHVDIEMLHQLASEPHDLSWAHLQGATPAWQQCFPAMHARQLWKFDAPTLHLDLPPQIEEAQASNAELLTIQLTAVSANVLALDGATQSQPVGRSSGPRTLRLDMQFHQSSVHAVGLQETRTDAGTFATPHYKVFSSGCERLPATALGCELWLSLTCQVLIAPGFRIPLAQFDSAVVVADPRRLFVRLTHAEFMLHFAVLHAPYVGASHSLSEVQQWWADTGRLLQELHFMHRLCVMIDANAPLGTNPGPGWGPAGAEPITPAGECFEAFLLQTQLYVPATFDHLHRSSHATWTHPRGHRSRKDYMLLTEDLFAMVTDSAVLDAHDTTFAHEDHLPVQVRLRGQTFSSKPVPRPTWDFEAMQDPSKCWDFQQALHSLPVPLWEVTVDSHALLWEKQVLQLGLQHFSLSRSKRHRFALAPDTLRSIASKRQLLQQPLSQLARHLQGEPAFVFDTTVLASLAGLLPVQDQLHAARLRYLKRFLGFCPKVLWQWLFVAADDPHSWLADCRDSFRWLHKFYKFPLAFSADDDWSHCFLAIQVDANWKGRVKAAAKACQRYRSAQAEYAVWLRTFRRTISATGAELPSDEPPKPLSQWTCLQCDARFASQRALAVHSHKMHGYKARARYFALGSMCNACGWDFADRCRLQRHLEHQPKCMSRYVACFPPADEATVEILDAADREKARLQRQQGWHSHKALRPALRVPGPLLPLESSVDAGAMYARAQTRQGTPGTRYVALAGRCDTVDQMASGGLWWRNSDLPSFVFQSNGGPQRGDGRLDYHGLARQAAILHIKAVTFIHFFSGFRRRDDLHHILQHQVYPTGVHFFVLSVDLCLQKEHANLADDGATRWWLLQVAKGLILGAGGGRPCETWTAARLLDNGPPPLRSAEDQLGLPHLSRLEHEQVMVGTRLSCFLHRILLELCRSGGCGFYEHPQYPVWAAEKAPCSTWAMEPAKLLRTFRCTSIISFDQCVYGAPAIKPTTLLLVRLNHFRHGTLRRGSMGRCAHPKGFHDALKGRDFCGDFKTARCKIYPSAMNAGIATAIQCYVQEVFPEEALCDEHVSQMPFEFQLFRVEQFTEHSVVQKDYHGPQPWTSTPLARPNTEDSTRLPSRIATSDLASRAEARHGEVRLRGGS
eukprot:Skav230323  [mRNA]  locus=scaffold430:518354:528265:+ [translate_table: standard]